MSLILVRTNRRCEGSTPEALQQIKEELFDYLAQIEVLPAESDR